MSGNQVAEGGCLCGGVRYRLTGVLRDVINCFCDQCRKTSGHHVAATSVANSGLQMISEDSLRWYASSDNAERGFCHCCGGNLFWRPRNSDRTSVMAGTIDHPAGLHTAENSFTEQMSGYHALPVLTAVK